MTRASDNEFPSVLFDEQPSDVSTPASGFWRAFFKSDGMYVIDDAGTVTGPFGAGGSGNVATDPIWNAAGDLVVGTGADAAARLAIAAADGAVLQRVSGAVAWTAKPASAVYTRSTGNYSTNSTSAVDIDGTNLSLTITTLARRVLIGFSGTVTNSGTSTTAIGIKLDGTQLGGTLASGLGGLMTVRQETAAYFANASFTFLTDVLSAGSHTFVANWCVAGSTSTLYGGGASTDRSYTQFYVIEQLV